MSYSRGSNSRWYTFGRVVPDGTLKRDHVFELCPFAEVTYAEIVEDFEAALDKLIIADDGGPVSAAEREELAGYMREFVREMDEKFAEQAKV